MHTPIIVPRDLERVLEFDVPEPLMARIAATTGPCGLAIAYLAGNAIVSAAMHDYPPGTARPGRLRKRLPPPPPGLHGVRLAFVCDDVMPVEADRLDLPALAPDIADFARGTLTVGDLPDEFAPGSTIHLPLTLTNESAFAWEPGITGVALRLDYDGEVRTLPLPCTVPPGEARPIAITIHAPAEPGTRSLVCTPILAPALPFIRGRTFRPLRLTLTIAAPKPAAADQPSCRLDLASPPGALLAGEAAILALTLTNTGTTRIEASGPGCLRLRPRWRREPRDGGPIRDPATTLLPYPLEPGAGCIVALDVTGPPLGGRYKVDVLAERVGYHSRLDDDHAVSPPAMIEVAHPDEIDNALEHTLRRDALASGQAADRLAYCDWAARCDTLDPAGWAALAGLSHWPTHPLIAIELVGDRIEEATAFLERQPYPAWRLVTAEEDAPDADLILRWNPSEGRLADHALLFFAGELVRNPQLAAITADFDHLNADGQRHDRVFLPPPDPFFARAQPQTATISASKPEYLTAASQPQLHPGEGRGPVTTGPLLGPGLRRGAMHPWPAAVAHIPQVLFHRYDTTALPHLNPADAPPAPPGWRLTKMHDVPGYAARPILPSPAPRVALIIPTRDRRDLLATFISTILERTVYPSYELIVIDNGSTDPDTLDYLSWLERQSIARVLRDDGPFNWSRLNNRAAALTDADIFCFLNNDMEVTHEGWLTELAALAALPEVGVVGATLWFPDGTIQHAGVAFTAQGGPMHPFRSAPRGTAPFYLRTLRTQPAVTGACLAVRREIFHRLGGFDELFPLGFNDIDFCMRVREMLGLPSVCTPAAELLHKESASRGRLRNDADRARSIRELAWFQGRHLETALADRWTDTVAHAAPPTASLAAIARYPKGARSAVRRYNRLSERPVAFIHIPRTAGTACREALDRSLPDGAVLSLGARAVVEGHAGNPATAARLAPLLRETEVLVSHISHGFGAAIGWDCRYATILRDPRARVRSHHGFLVAPPNAPLQGTPLADWPLAALLRKGVIPGNLMLAKILGEPPEPVRWPQIDGRFPRYAGFGLPAALWTGDMDALTTLPDLAPDHDEEKVARALAIIERDFLFVGLQERLGEHLAHLAAALDIPAIGEIPRVNVSRDTTELSPADEEAITAYNALDRLLYDAIAARPGGLFIRD
ncbi:glycosyltransferase family 2 protein [Sphingomonas radiodurans]|uniref:glycosyltransferase family 2 protein n=1 Tax=Sphingomonas radiodurans TaxID=2890321 RepID=UPI001E36FE0B|nr:glycosyltransferase family 2 protein [Sphingomonas radiodurans]WBH15797.1 glycosyltransferase family 2 protein [Sphingomonas radiodurans]